MKKTFSILFTSLLVISSVFAGDFKWKAADFFKQKKFDKIIEAYNLSETYNNGNVKVYKSEDGTNWIYHFTVGDEQNKDKQVFKYTFAYLDGIFDSCTVYGSYTGANTFPYLFGVITESDYILKKSDFQENSTWVWTNPLSCFRFIFVNRLNVFTMMNDTKNIHGITIPINVQERYLHFNSWWNSHANFNNVDTELKKEYKKYIKENPIN